jgi:hypothetical protein
MRFSDTFLLLQNESYLIESCIAHGLNSLRNSDLRRKGNFYTAFFQLSVGIERLMKINLIMDHMAKHNLATPTGDVMRSHGHNLIKLFGLMRSLASWISPHPLEAIRVGSIEHEILQFLADCADSSGRYFNLNRLTEGKEGVDPLRKWDEILFRILIEHVPRRIVDRIIGEAKVLTMLMPRDGAVVLASDLHGQMLDFERMVGIGVLYDAAAPYAVCSVLNLVRPLRELSIEVGDKALYGIKSQGGEMPVPAMSEFLVFALTERRDVLRKKRWP